MKARSPICVWLARSAWLLTLPWFVLATAGAWGFWPAGFIVWSAAAGPLWLITHYWLERAGRPPSQKALLLLGASWGVLALGVFAFFKWAPDTSDALAVILGTVTDLYALFPLAVTVWVFTLTRNLGVKQSS